jgi:hypothetical protein
MKVSKAIEYLSEEDPDSEIMIQWFTKEHVEGNLNKEISPIHWDKAVGVFDEGDVSMDDFQVVWCLNDAGEI